MAEFKLVISDPKTGLTVQKEAKEQAAQRFIGLKITDKVKGETIDLQGYEFEITGGSDYCGFPMRKDVQGTGRKKIMAVSGIGIKRLEKGIKQRKTVCGNIIHARTAQINLKILQEGKEKLFEAVAKKEKVAEEKKEVKEETPVKKEVKKEALEKKEIKEEKVVKKEEKVKAAEAKKETKPEKKAEEKKEAKSAEEKKEKAPKA